MQTFYVYDAVTEPVDFGSAGHRHRRLGLIAAASGEKEREAVTPLFNECRRRNWEKTPNTWITPVYIHRKPH
jgi:hypothetical protein